MGLLNPFPLGQAQQQLGMSMTATQPTPPTDAGFGVACWRGTRTAELAYEFVVWGDGSWSVSRRDGNPSATTTNLPINLKEGTSPSVPGSAPLTVIGICAALSDKQTTRLVLFIDGTQVADVLDVATNMPGTGWLANLLVATSDARPSPVTTSRFEQRNLAR